MTGYVSTHIQVVFTTVDEDGNTTDRLPVSLEASVLSEEAFLATLAALRDTRRRLTSLAPRKLAGFGYAPVTPAQR